MLNRRSTKINRVLLSDISEDVLNSGKQAMLCSVVVRLNPFSLQNSPKRFGDIEMRGIRRKIEYVETSLFPSFEAFLYFATLVNTGVIQYDNSLLVDCQREVFHKFYELVGVDVFLRGEAMIDAVAVYHSEEVEPAAFECRDKKILILKFPCVRNISFCTDMTFVTVIEVNETFLPLTFKLLQQLFLICEFLRRGLPLWSFSYTSKSCAREDKKFLKAPSLIFLPVAFSHASLALETLWRCCSIAFLTASLSSLVLMIRLRPVPGLFFKPSRPSDRNLLTQCVTLWCVCPARAPASLLLKPSALHNTMRHRIRRQWLAPFRNPFSKEVRCSSVIFIFVACLDIVGEINECKTITSENGFHCVKSFIKHT